jgi:hypothetical protein
LVGAGAGGSVVGGGVGIGTGTTTTGMGVDGVPSGALGSFSTMVVHAAAVTTAAAMASEGRWATNFMRAPSEIT